MAVETLQAGRLNLRITLLSPSLTVEDAGGALVTYTAAKTVWAEKRAATSREVVALRQIMPEAEAVFRIRYDDAVENDWRISHRGVWDILSVTNLGTHMVLVAKQHIGTT